jgi:putative DNA primase/helicase
MTDDMSGAPPWTVEEPALAPDAEAPRQPRRRRKDDEPAGPTPKRGLPVIAYAGGRLSSATDEAERLLAASDGELFQSGDLLVRLGFDVEMTIADGTTIRGPRLIKAEHVHLQDRMTKYIDFQKFDAKLNDFKCINAPPDVAMALLQRKGLWKYLRQIAGLATAPTLRADGSIIDQPGYDAKTRVLYIEPPGITFETIPPNPTKDMARASLDNLCDLISEFPFVAEDGSDATGRASPSRSVALSGFITPMIRRAIPTAPFHAFDATAAGSGKSKLVSIASVIARGHEAPVVSGANIDPKEFEKKISACLIAGDSIVAIDNIEGPLGGELLCSATTEAMLNIRILGASKYALVPNNAVFFGNGNSLVIIGDMGRRTLRGSLDPRVEKPELRTFKGADPVLRAKQNRVRCVTDTLTVVRAYWAAGRPRQAKTPLGSFEEWSRLVRDALLWLGEPDPCDTMERTQQQDPKRNALAAVLYQWRDVMGDSEATAKGAVDIATEKYGGGPTEAPIFRYPDFRDALMTVAGDKGNFINPTRLGQWLGRNKGRVINRSRIESGISIEHGGAVRWKVVSV